ncbi:MAG: hypothetical protein HY697_01350 [Deltaproteobacteria bacterium]|nr:hypothetical protein [Deltaproteobacteria bacterium]
MVNQNGISVRPQEKDSSFRPWPIAPFERESSLSFMVTNASVITPSTGVTLASRPQSPYPDLTAPPAVSDWIVLAFSLTVDPQESVLIRSLTTTGLALGNRIPTSGLKLYIDGDRDGFIDASGLFALPVATGSYDPGTGRAVFSDPVLLWSGTSTNFILTLDFTSPPSPSLWAYRGRLAVMFFGPFLATVLGSGGKPGAFSPSSPLSFW